MADKWMDERDRRWRERDWRGSEAGGREEPTSYGREDRSFGGGDKDFGARRGGADRDRVFGEQDSGAGYNRPQPSGQTYGRGPGAAQTGGDYRENGASGDHAHGRAWQGRDYQGVSPAMGHDEYDTNGGRAGGGAGRPPRFGAQDYTQGGRFYGDDTRQPIYREEYGQGGVEYGPEPRGYDARRDSGPSGGRYGGSYGGAGGDYGYRSARPAYGGTASGGTGGYDFERGYGDGGRSQERHDAPNDFLTRAGQRVREWFRGEDLMRGSAPSDRGYSSDFGRERRYFPDQGAAGRDARGMGPKGYKRSDARISEEVHERLTDDSWLDASNIDIEVSGGEVTLTGSVENREAKHRAERIVEDIAGVDHVQNNLRINRANPLTGSGHGFGDNAAELQARRDDPAANGSGGAAGTKPGANGSTTGKV